MITCASPSGEALARSARKANTARRRGGLLYVALMQYQTLRSVSDHHVFVICRDGSFYEFVPRDVRKQGPWQGMQRGEVEKLKHRLALARDGYALVKCELAVFKPES